MTLDELTAILSDPIERLTCGELYKIVNKEGRVVKFIPNEQQLQFIRECHGHDILLKARQLGMTTLAGIMSVDECVFNSNWSASIIAHTQKDAQKILRNQVKFPYVNLPEMIRIKVPAVADSADTLALANGSRVIVSTSARGDTLQRLHISEFGKICARFPDKAQEIVTGALPAAEKGRVTIESTAEGQDGYFYNMTQQALNHKRRGDVLTEKDFKFHFYPWWESKEYRMDPEAVLITDQDARYFSRLKDNGIDLLPEQKAWYVKMQNTLGAEMKREYPATPEEAFEQALEGAYFEQQLSHAYRSGNIGRFVCDLTYPVNTFWDLGRNDSTSIWFHQNINGRNRFVGYYENAGEYIGHYIHYLRDWQQDRGIIWGDHYWPHDGRRQDLFLENGRLDVAADFGFHPIIVNRTPNKIHAIESARLVFASCDFDEGACAEGIKRLKAYRKEWDEQRGVWKDRPHHGPESHGADAFLTFATGYVADERYEDEEYDERITTSATGY